MGDFARLFEDSIKVNKFKPGAILHGEVVKIDKDFVTVDVGLKSEGIISKDQFYNQNGEFEVEVGSDIEVVLDIVEDGWGETRLSREKAKRAEAWKGLKVAHEDQAVVRGLVVNKVKGGLIVEINGIRAFLPGSQMDVRPAHEVDISEGELIDVKVIKIDEERNNVVVSRRAVIEHETSAEREEILSKLEVGQVVDGVVKNITDYGAFIDLGGIDGLLHVTDISWKRIQHPSDVLSLKDKIKVKVLVFDKARNRVSLGLKQLGTDPWENIAERFPIGAKITGKVGNIEDYGCFVEIADGIEGLVHVSEMSWTNKNVNPNKLVQVGQEIEIVVLDIDLDRRRISLGLKQCNNNPWSSFSEKHNKGDHVTGKIQSITDFGIFIGLEGGIDGLVHLSDIAWDVAGEEAIRNYKKGQDVDTVILSIDPERERISLGIKQLTGDSFEQYTVAHPKGSIVTGKVVEINEKDAKVELAEDVFGVLKANEISSQEKVYDAREALKEDEEVEAKIVSIDSKNRTIHISIKAKDVQDEKKVMKEMSKEAKITSTLGDFFKGQFGGKKSDDES